MASTRLGGRYEIVREIGEGGMGRVFQAIDTETGQTVAAKVLIAGETIDLQALLRFQQEGAVLSTMEHPNIVRVFSAFLDEQTACIIVELLEGRRASTVIREVPCRRSRRPER
jgi:serine/threonine-protein kinase